MPNTTPDIKPDPTPMVSVSPSASSDGDANTLALLEFLLDQNLEGLESALASAPYGLLPAQVRERLLRPEAEVEARRQMAGRMDLRPEEAVRLLDDPAPEVLGTLAANNALWPMIAATLLERLPQTPPADAKTRRRATAVVRGLWHNRQLSTAQQAALYAALAGPLAGLDLMYRMHPSIGHRLAEAAPESWADVPAAHREAVLTHVPAHYRAAIVAAIAASDAGVQPTTDAAGPLATPSERSPAGPRPRRA